ncbi:MAG: hypothetical protein JSW28_10085 [Thermoplasmata archaeon]|nr:MAG: hypothetical protein JSW28_10085 [Thermoplasmata archaeon]
MRLDINEMFRKLTEKSWAWAVYVPLTVALDLLISLTLMLSFATSCFGVILTGIATFGVPYLFGVRSVRTYLKTGSVIILVTGILFGVVYTHFLYEQIYFFEERTIDDTYLENGSVTPYLGDDTTSFNYTVTYTGPEAPEDVAVFVNISELGSKDERNISLKGAGRLYYNETLQDRNIYFYYFSLYTNTTNSWNYTEVGVGPITSPYSDQVGLQVLQWVISMFLNGGLMFYMLVLLYNWKKVSQEERKRMEEELLAGAKEEKEEKEEETEKEIEEEEEEIKEEEVEFECTTCGATVGADETACPQCGEDFEGEEEEGEK